MIELLISILLFSLFIVVPMVAIFLVAPWIMMREKIKIEYDPRENRRYLNRSWIDDWEHRYREALRELAL